MAPHCTRPPRGAGQRCYSPHTMRYGSDLVVDLPEEGEYEVYCPIDSHREQGMEGTITVK